MINGKRVGSGEFGKLARKHAATDGLNSLNYKVIGKTERYLYTNIEVDLDRANSKEFGLFEYGKDDIWTKRKKGGSL